MTVTVRNEWEDYVSRPMQLMADDCAFDNQRVDLEGGETAEVVFERSIGLE